jgi:S-adenosylmethionine:tRNA ribosyltransferase-isomerase
VTFAYDLAAYDFELPDASIAQHPIEPRHASRLLCLDRTTGALVDRTVLDLAELLPKEALLVLNDTRVVPARLDAYKDTGGHVELLLTRPFRNHGPDLLEHEALYRTSKGLKVGQRLRVQPDAVAVVREVKGDGVCVVDLEGASDLAELLERCGHVPLPPYIHAGKETPVDRERYQTTFARQPGAVAAPTASLHLSTELLARLDARGIERATVTLHVGPGTFLPVRSEDLRNHRVLPERFAVDAQAAEQLQRARDQHRPIIAVGTTTTRTLETLALRSGSGPLQAMAGDADLTILPGHAFQLVTGLVTNFHLPRSSLLVLVSAFAGREPVLAAYRHAVQQGYRFYSYGDAMLIA